METKVGQLNLNTAEDFRNAQQELFQDLTDNEVSNKMLYAINMILDEIAKESEEITVSEKYLKIISLLTLAIVENNERIFSRNIAEETLNNMIANQTIKGLYFICSPLRGSVDLNIEVAEGYCKKITEMGFIPFAPHVYFTRFLDDSIENERDFGIDFGIQMLKHCEKLVCFLQGGITAGMRKELDFAKENNIPIIGIKTLEDLENLKV